MLTVWFGLQMKFHEHELTLVIEDRKIRSQLSESRTCALTRIIVVADEFESESGVCCSARPPKYRLSLSQSVSVCLSLSQSLSASLSLYQSVSISLSLYQSLNL